MHAHVLKLFSEAKCALGDTVQASSCAVIGKYKEAHMINAFLNWKTPELITTDHMLCFVYTYEWFG